MKHNSKGFTLLEVIIYILFFSFITTITALWMVRMWNVCMLKGTKQKSLISLYGAHDILIRDIQEAPADYTQWKEQQADCIIWHTPKADIGWCKQKDRLVRIEGMYDRVKKEWTKQTKSVVAMPVKAVTFTFAGKAELSHIVFIIDDGMTVVENNVSPLCNLLRWNSEKT